LIVRDGGTLNLTGTTLSGANVSRDNSRVEFQVGSSGTIRFSKFNIPLTIHSSGTLSVHHNDFANATVVLTGDPDDTVVLQRNWWGTVIRSEIESRITAHHNDPARPHADYSFWLVNQAGTLIGFHATHISPDQYLSRDIQHVDVTFNHEVLPDTFTVEDVRMFGPDGPVAVTDITEVSAHTFRVEFEPLTSDGEFALSIGADILNFESRLMDQNLDGIPGDAFEDVFRAALIRDSVAPYVVGHVPGGNLAGTLCFVDLEFSEPIDVASLTPQAVAIVMEDESTAHPERYEVLSETIYRAWLPDLPTVGSLTLRVGPTITDLAGNMLDQNDDGQFGQPEDVYEHLIEMVDAHFDVSNVTAPAAVVGIDPLTVTWEVEYLGQGIEGSTPAPRIDHWTDRIILARDPFLGGDGEVLVAEISYDTGISPGESYSGTWSGVLPDDVSGEFYVFVTSGVGNQLPKPGYQHVAMSPDTTDVVRWVQVSGTIAEDTEWRGRIQLSGTVTVAQQATLTIAPGTVIKSLGGALDVRGSLVAAGTASDPVIFTSWLDDTAGGDANEDGGATTPSPSDWTGIVLRDSDRIEFEHVEIRYADNGIAAYTPDVAILLRNSSLIRNNVGLWVYYPLVSVQVTNCLVYRNATVGLFLRADSAAEITNCTIVENGLSPGEVLAVSVGGHGYAPWTPSGIHLGAPKVNINNTIVAYNANGLHHGQANAWDDPPQVTVRRSLLWNPDGSDLAWYENPASRPNVEHPSWENRFSDPLFLDAPAGNFELGPFSPAIDAGRAIGAPATDILGRPRFDDWAWRTWARGILRTSTSAPTSGRSRVCRMPIWPWFQRVGLAAGRRLADDPITVTWTVENTGQRNLTDPWIDAIYLSSDPHLSTSGDRLLAEIPRTEGPGHRRALHADLDRADPR
jgi:hypothetical protein